MFSLVIMGANIYHMPTVLLFYDYADPLSWILDRRLAAAASGSDLSVERFPFPVDWAAEEGAPGSSWNDRQAVADRLAAGVGAELRRRALPTQGLKAFELAFLATERGCFDTVHDAIFRSHFVDGRDIGRIDELVRIARSAGIDASEAKAALDVDTFSERVEEWRHKALRLGVTTAPTVFVGDRCLEGTAAAEEVTLAWVMTEP